MKEGYRDVKFSTMVGKLNKYLAGQNLIGIPKREYPKRIEEAVNRFFEEVNYPFCLYWYSQSCCFVVYLKADYELKITELHDRYSLSKAPVGKRLKTFKRFICSGSRFDDKISELIRRRKNGITFWADESAWEIRKFGYDSPEEFAKAYEKAQELVKNAFGIWLRYQSLSDSEKKSISGSA